MKKVTALTALAVVGLIAAGSSAMAFGGHKNHGEGQRGHGPRMNFEELDTNADGKLSKEEIQAGAKGPFSNADANADGKITKDEMVAAAGERAAKRFDRMVEKHDTDKDGALTMEEIKTGKREARMDKMFERADADNDGFISKDEMEDMRGKHRGWKKN